MFSLTKLRKSVKVKKAEMFFLFISFIHVLVSPFLLYKFIPKPTAEIFKVSAVFVCKKKSQPCWVGTCYLFSLQGTEVLLPQVLVLQLLLRLLQRVLLHERLLRIYFLLSQHSVQGVPVRIPYRRIFHLCNC